MKRRKSFKMKNQIGISLDLGIKEGMLKLQTRMEETLLNKTTVQQKRNRTLLFHCAWLKLKSSGMSSRK